VASTGGAAGANDCGGGVNVGGGGSAAGASGDGVPLNLPIPGKRSPTVSGLCVGMVTDGVGEGGGGAGGAGGATAGAVGITQSLGLGGAAVSQSGGAGVAAGPGTRPRATSRGSTSLVIRALDCGTGWPLGRLRGRLASSCDGLEDGALVAKGGNGEISIHTREAETFARQSLGDQAEIGRDHRGDDRIATRRLVLRK
jgi:hypothetical protein